MPREREKSQILGHARRRYGKWSEGLFVGEVTDTLMFPNCRPFASPFPAPAGPRYHEAGRQGDVFAEFERAMIYGQPPTPAEAGMTISPGGEGGEIQVSFVHPKRQLDDDEPPPS
jgi:hypothetical protein